jgi:uncharacterized membrane protein (UPF0127 family)
MNVTRGIELGQKVRVASTFFDRTMGLLGTASLAAGEGLWLSPCKSIHTFFMRYPIDVLFLDRDGKVLHQKTYAPWKLSGWFSKSRGVLELAAGSLSQSRVGDRIEMVEGPACRQAGVN